MEEMEYSIDVNLDLHSEDYVTEEEHQLMTLTEDELAQLLAESDENILQQEEIFDVPVESVQPLFLCFLQRCMKVVIQYSAELASVNLEEALDTVEKLVNIATPDKMADLSRAVVVQYPTAVSVFLDFALKVWQGQLVDNAHNEFEDNLRSLVRLIWNILENYKGNILSVVTPNMLRDLVEALGTFQNVVLANETHTFVCLYIIKLLRTIAREDITRQQLVEWNCPNSLVRLLPTQPIEVRIPIKSLIGLLVPYCDPAKAVSLKENVLMTDDDLSFMLYTLVPSCEMADGRDKSIKIQRLLRMVRDLAANPANQKALVDNGALEIFQELAEHNDRLKEEVISSLSLDTHSLMVAQQNNCPLSGQLPVEPWISEEPPVSVKVTSSTRYTQEVMSSFPSDDGTVELVDGITLELTKCVDALERGIENCDESSFDDALVVQAMTLTNMLLNVAGTAMCGSEWLRPVADHIAQDASFVEGLCKLLHICYTHKFSKEVLGIAFTAGDFAQTCLIQWTHHSYAMCRAVGGAGLAHYLLSALNLQKEKVFNEVEIESVQNILCLLYNIARHQVNLPAFYSTEAMMSILIPYSRCSLGKIGLYTKCVLSFLQLLMNNDELHNLEFTEEEVMFFVNALSTVVKSGKATAEGFSIEEILIILTNVTSLGKSQIASQAKPEILASLDETIKSTVDVIKKQSIHFLLNLVQSSEDHVNLPQTTIQSLTALEEDASFIQSMAHCLLHFLNLNTAAQNEIHECLLCSEGFYQLSKYQDCIEKCNLIISKAKQVKVEQGTLNRAKLLKGKALFYSYQRQQIQFMRERQFLSEREVSERINHVYNKAKESVFLLGNALDNNFLDAEGSRLLDFAMMDYMRETNKLHDCRRCLLCRERKERNEIKLSHYIPRAILKIIGEEYIEGEDHKFFLQLDGKIAFHSAGECTFRMLCGDCEQRLNQNGETIFTERLFPKVYNNGPVVSASVTAYESWLYSFCLGIIFRGLATERFAAVMNADEVYETFLICRDHLKKLPVKRPKQNQLPADCEPILNTPGLTEKFLEVYFLINPVTVNNTGDGMRLKQLATILQSTGSPFLSTVRLHDGKAYLSTLAHFFTAHFASCNVIMKFQPSAKAKLPSWSMINPNGGVYEVHEESQRWEHFPTGFWSAQLFASYKFEKVALDYFISTKTSKKSKQFSRKDQNESDLIPGVPDSSEISEVFSSAKVTPNIDQSFFSDFCSAPFVINLLPHGYRVTKFGSGFVRSITLPHGHQFILHSTIVKSHEEKCATIILAIKTSTIKCIKTNTVGIYLIGVFSGKKGQVVDLINEENTEKIVSQHETASLSLLERETQTKILEMLPQVLKAKGVYSIQSIIRQMKCRAQCNDQCFSMDQKCIGGCWYCTDLCNTCMVCSAVPGLSVAEDIDGNSMILKHCSEACLERFSSKSLSFPAEITQPSLLHASVCESQNCIFRVSRMVQTTGSTLTHVTLHLCVDGSKNVDARIVVLVHVCTRILQHFLEFEMNQDMKLGQILEYLQEMAPPNVIAQVQETNIVTGILSSTFEQLGILNLSSLLTHHTHNSAN